MMEMYFYAVQIAHGTRGTNNDQSNCADYIDGSVKDRKKMKDSILFQINVVEKERMAQVTKAKNKI